MDVADGEQLHVESAAEFGDWLEREHAAGPGVWVVTWRSATGRPAPSYEDLVVEALRFGYVDSQAKRLDDERSAQRFTPRRPGGGWARTNKDRVALLEAEGRMAPAGQAVVDAARADGTWTLLDDVENLVVPGDLAAALAAEDGARAHWDGFPRSSRRAMLLWLLQAKRPATRASRVAEVAARAAAGERARA